MVLSVTGGPQGDRARAGCSRMLEPAGNTLSPRTRVAPPGSPMWTLPGQAEAIGPCPIPARRPAERPKTPPGTKKVGMTLTLLIALVALATLFLVLGWRARQQILLRGIADPVRGRGLRARAGMAAGGSAIPYLAKPAVPWGGRNRDRAAGRRYREDMRAGGHGRAGHILVFTAGRSRQPLHGLPQDPYADCKILVSGGEMQRQNACWR